MSWVRSNLRFGSWCALLALAIQLIVLFNHVHCQQGTCLPGSQPAIGTLADGSGDAPSQSKPASADYCMLCAVSHLAGNVVPASAPVAFLSPTLDAGPIWTDLSLWRAATPHGIFQARAPPLA
jgi:hypothetical protein